MPGASSNQKGESMDMIKERHRIVAWLRRYHWVDFADYLEATGKMQDGASRHIGRAIIAFKDHRFAYLPVWIKHKTMEQVEREIEGDRAIAKDLVDLRVAIALYSRNHTASETI